MTDRQTDGQNDRITTAAYSTRLTLKLNNRINPLNRDANIYDCCIRLMLLMFFGILTVKAAPVTLHTSVSQLRLISYLAHGISFAAGVSLMGKNVTFCSARYNFKTCDFASGVVNVNGVVHQY